MTAKAQRREDMEQTRVTPPSTDQPGWEQLRELVAKLRDDELFGPLLEDKLHYYPTVTREPFRNRGRITDLITSKQLFDDIGLPPLDIESDRIMMCGSPAMLEELRQTFEARGFAEGSHSEPGHFVIEKAFVER